MTQRLILAPAALASLLALGACADSHTGYPSLLPRPIEKMSTAEPVRAAPVVTADPTLDSTIATLTKALNDTATGWTMASRATATKVAAARGKAAGSDAWLDAQTALADLDQYRAQTAGTLSQAEEAAIAREQDAKPPYPALEALRDTATAQLAAESKEIAERQATLPGT